MCVVHVTHNTLNVRIITQSLKNDLSCWSVLWIQAVAYSWRSKLTPFSPTHLLYLCSVYEPRAVNRKISSPAQVFIMSFSCLEDASESHSFPCGFEVITILCLYVMSSTSNDSFTCAFSDFNIESIMNAQVCFYLVCAFWFGSMALTTFFTLKNGSSKNEVLSRTTHTAL